MFQSPGRSPEFQSFATSGDRVKPGTHRVGLRVVPCCKQRRSNAHRILEKMSHPVTGMGTRVTLDVISRANFLTRGQFNPRLAWVFDGVLKHRRANNKLALFLSWTSFFTEELANLMCLSI